MNQKQLEKLNGIKNDVYKIYQALSEFENMTETRPVLQQLRDAVEGGNAVILDTETTGLNDGEIVEIAIVDVSGGKILMNERIKPKNGIPADSTAVHGITEDLVARSPGFEDLVTEIKGHLAGRDVIVYNATYDRKMLHRSAEHAGIDRVNWKSFSNWICAMEAFSPIFGDWNPKYGNYKWQKLTTAADYYKIPTQHAHSALGDCLMTLEVVRKMIETTK